MFVCAFESPEWNAPYTTAVIGGERKKGILYLMKGTTRKAETLTEQSLKDSELRYRRLFEAAQDGILILDAETGMIDDANPYLIKMLGYSRAEFIKKKLWEVGAFKDIDASQVAFETLQENEYIRYEDLPLKTKDGQLIQVEFVSNVYQVGDKKVIQCNIRNVTERKRAEERLEEERLLLRTLIDNLPDRIYVKDAQGRKILSNMADWQASGGKTMEDVIGKTDFDIYPPELAENFWAIDKTVIDSGISIINREEPGLDSQGNPVWILSSKVPLHDHQGKILGLVGIGRDITEHKQAETALQESKLMTERIIDAIPVRVFWKDKNLVYLGCNTLYAHDKRFTDPKEVIGKDDYQMAMRDQAELYRADDRKVIESGRAKLHAEEYHTSPDGKTRTLLTSKVPLRSPNRDIIGVLGTYMDITERKQAQAARQESERRFRDMQENIDLIAVMLDLNGRVTFCNDYLLNLTGHSRASVLGQDWFELFVPPESDIKEDFMGALQQGNIPAHMENEILTTSGERRLISWNNIVLRDAEGRVIGTNSIGEDITERKRMEETLRQNDKRFRALIENSTDAITLLDAKGIAVYDSPASPGMLGYGPTDWIGEDVFALIHPDDLPEIRDLFENLTNTPNGRVNCVFRVRHKSGSWLWMEMVATNLLAEPGVEAIVLNYRNISERKQAEQKIERRVAELETLYQSGIAFSQTFDQRDIGEKLIELLSIHLNWHHAAVRVRRVDSEDVELVAYMQPGEERDGGLRMQSVITQVGQGLAGWVIQNEKPLRVNNLEEDPRYIATFDGMHAGLYVPMRTHNQTIGCISVESDQLNAFTEEDEHLLITLATQAAVAMRNAELFEGMQKELAQRKLAEKRIQRQLGHLTALSSIDRIIAASLDLKFNLSEILTHVTAELGIDAASILVLNSSSQMLEYGAERGFRTKAVRKAQVRVGESYAGRVALERQLVQIPTLRDEPDNVLLTTLLEGEDFACYYGVPLISKGRVVGVLEVFHRTILEPDAEWFDFLHTLAGQAALAIENASLFENLQHSNMELSLAYDATIEGWSNALDLRDKETEGHTLRVTEMTVTFARDFGLNENELVQVRRGALLHDIGKMGIPDEILLKPGPLTDEEWVKMKQHPTFAYELLSPIRYLQQALDIPYCHHEKWDGSGYPRGLKG